MNGTEPTHPSDLALDRGGPEFETHVASRTRPRRRPPTWLLIGGPAALAIAGIVAFGACI